MATPEDDGKRHERDEATNPFVNFRRFADAQMSSLITNISGIFESSPVRRQQVIDEYESTLKKYREQQNPELRAQIGREVGEAKRVMDIYIRANQDDTAQVDVRPTREEYKDDGVTARMERGVERCPYRPSDSLGPLDLLPYQSSTLDITYLFNSPYSPLALEKLETFRSQSGKMRAAFADLLAVQGGEGLLPENTPDKHEGIAPVGWAANMGSMMLFGRGRRRWETALDGQMGGGWAGALRTMRLLGHAADNRETEGRRGQGCGPDQVEGGNGDTALQKALKGKLGPCEFIGLLDRIAGLGPEPDVYKVEEEAYIRAYDDDIGDANDVDDNGGACICLHCRNYERRKQEYHQWRREELEEEGAGEDDDVERTMNPTSELDQYHALADHQARLLTLDQQQQQFQEQQQRAQQEKQQNRQESTRPSEQTPATTNKPSILSTLTTTEQRTLPDGTVTTKVVLKKRFSDGGEEVTERTHTQNAPLVQKEMGNKGGIGQEDAKKTHEKTNKGGWFWS